MLNALLSQPVFIIRAVYRMTKMPINAVISAIHMQKTNQNPSKQIAYYVFNVISDG